MKILIVILLLLLLPFAGTVFLYEQFFGPRIEPQQDLVKRTIADYPNLVRDGVEFPSNRGQVLRGFVYKHTAEQKPKGLIIISHGLGGNHEGYFEEIALFAAEGFWVLGFDNTGTYSSDGKGIRGLPQAVLDLRAAIDFIATDAALNSLPRLIYGHSMGGYASCAVLNYSVNVDGVVSIAGFNRSQDMILEFGKQRFGNWIAILSPYISLYEMIKFGGAANLTAAEGIRSCRTRALLIHGDADSQISLKSSILRHFAEVSHPRVKTNLVADGSHNLNFSNEALDYKKDVNRKWGEVREQYQDAAAIPVTVVQETVDSIDRDLLHRLNAELMREIVDFFLTVAKTPSYPAAE